MKSACTWWILDLQPATGQPSNGLEGAPGSQPAWGVLGAQTGPRALCSRMQCAPGALHWSHEALGGLCHGPCIACPGFDEAFRDLGTASCQGPNAEGVCPLQLSTLLAKLIKCRGSAPGGFKKAVKPCTTPLAPHQGMSAAGSAKDAGKQHATR